MKRVVICSDGTWQTPNQDNATHVLEMARAVLPTAPDGTTQVVFYDWGVGTDNWLNRLVGGISGKGIDKNIRDCYRFLVHNYEDGDEIYRFGFSRGAYTVRSLAGLIRNCGILTKAKADKIGCAYKLYRRREAGPDCAEAEDFRSEHSREATVKFIGVWDTVGALGIPLRGLSKLTAQRYKFHDVKLSRRVPYAYHALAIDERRRPFRPSLWEVQTNKGQIVEQVWFAGVHSDVGGAPDEELGNPSFDWMKDRASSAGLALGETPVSSSECPNKANEPAGSLGRTVARLREGLAQPRPIGGDDTQWVHPSALTHYAGAPSGVPANLAVYLARSDARIYGEEG